MSKINAHNEQTLQWCRNKLPTPSPAPCCLGVARRGISQRLMAGLSVLTKLVNSNVGWESSYPVYVASPPSTQPSMQTAKGSNGTETERWLSQPTFEFTSLVLLLHSSLAHAHKIWLYLDGHTFRTASVAQRAHIMSPKATICLVYIALAGHRKG